MTTETVSQQEPSRARPANRSRRPLGRVSGRLALLSCAGALLSGCGVPSPQERLAAEAEEHWRLLNRYCVDCHNAVEYTADIAFDRMRPETIQENAAVWEKAIRQLRGRVMPPPGGRRPEHDEVEAFVAWMESVLDQAAHEPGPERLVIHRLNRTEYANAVRDLLAMDVDAEALLPVDDAESGFDTIARALQVTPTFVDQYLDAAITLSAQAIGNSAPRPVGVPYRIGNARAQQVHVHGLPLGTRGGAVIEHYFPADGEYLLSIADLVTGLWVFDQEHVNTLVATIDGKPFFELDIGGGEDLKALDQIGAPAVDLINARLKNIPFMAEAGMRRIGVAFLHRSFAESDRHLHALVPGGGQDSVLTLSEVEIFGPVRATGISDTPSRRKIFSCHPDAGGDGTACAREIITRLAEEAFRGLATADDITRLMALYEIGAEDADFEAGIRFALSGVLAHPKFLYRGVDAGGSALVSSSPARTDSVLVSDGGGSSGEGGARAAQQLLSGPELASRLSFFLWRSIPDEELRRTAMEGRLHDRQVLERQVRRLLSDPRSRSLASDFAYQWLTLGKLNGIVPDNALFADVDRNIREYFVEEIERFADSIFREDRSILDLLTASHTYLNQPLALHYGINDVRGSRFRRVDLEDEVRWGLLGKGGVLMVSSYPNRTSPVLRGAWVLEEIIGTPPAEPPPGVEGLVENIAGQPAATVRERLEAHREIPSCNGCHGVIDPLGFALENFDAVGRWREIDREAGEAIDASGVLADGTGVDGPIALREAILARPEQFVQTFTEKLMTYALGRTLDHTDMPAVRRIVRETAADSHRFSAIVLAIVNTEQFRHRAVSVVETDALSVRAAD